MKLWLWVILCSAAIFSTIPLARSLQKFVYASLGKEFFTYTVLFSIAAVLIAILYFLFFRLKVRNISRYAWLLLCGGAFGWFTIQLGKHPEEAVHLLEYGLLAFFVFRALNHRVRDNTVYISTGLIVLFVGLTDEFIQWMVPSRVWDYRDIGINGLAGAFFLLAINRVIRPGTVNQPVKKYSLKVLAVIITIVLTVFGLCLSNTPDIVNGYTSRFSILSWLDREETMTEYGYLHSDSDAGAFYSRMTLEELKETDQDKGEIYGRTIKKGIKKGNDISSIKSGYSQHENPFMYEFFIHVKRRNEKLKYFSSASEKNKMKKTAHKALREHLILKEYFGSTLKHSGLDWPEERVEDLKRTALLHKKDYVSEAGRLITAFGLETVWVFIIGSISLVWLYTGYRKTN